MIRFLSTSDLMRSGCSKGSRLVWDGACGASSMDMSGLLSVEMSIKRRGPPRGKFRNGARVCETGKRAIDAGFLRPSWLGRRAGRDGGLACKRRLDHVGGNIREAAGQHVGRGL